MPAKKSKKPAPIETRDQAEEAMRNLAYATAARDSQLADLNAKIADLKAQYESDIAAADEVIRNESKRLEDWADARPELFSKIKSVKLLAGVVGYRLSPPSVKLVPGVKLPTAVALVRSKMPAYLRVAESIDKSAILAAYRQSISDVDLAACGLRVASVDEFYATPDAVKPTAEE